MSNIYDSPLSFNLVKNYISFTFKRYYGEYIVVGRENIPTDCPVIFAPNHTNALMDALAVHTIAPQNVPVIFLARADLFKNKKAAKALTFAKIIPAFRMRDGIENLGRNQEIFDNCVEVLTHNKALGIMPEGNQEIERKLRPIVKGIFRIAFATQLKYGNQPKVKIIPIGLDFGDILHYGKHIIINIGEPIEVSEYMNQYAENPVTATNEIRDKLRNSLCDLSLNLATEKYYECFETVVAAGNTAFLEKLQLTDSTFNRHIARQKIAEKLIDLEKNEPDKMAKLNDLSQSYAKNLKEFNLRNWVFEKSPDKAIVSIMKALLLLLGLPLFVAGFTLNCLPFFTPVYLRKKVFKAEFIGFFSSLQYALGSILFPVFYILQTVIFGCTISTSWWLTLAFLVCQYPLGKVAFRYYKSAIKCWADVRFCNLKKKQPEKIAETVKLREEIIRIIGANK